MIEQAKQIVEEYESVAGPFINSVNELCDNREQIQLYLAAKAYVEKYS